MTPPAPRCTAGIYGDVAYESGLLHYLFDAMRYRRQQARNRRRQARRIERTLQDLSCGGDLDGYAFQALLPVHKLLDGAQYWERAAVDAMDETLRQLTPAIMRELRAAQRRGRQCSGA